MNKGEIMNFSKSVRWLLSLSLLCSFYLSDDAVDSSAEYEEQKIEYGQNYLISPEQSHDDILNRRIEEAMNNLPKELKSNKDKETIEELRLEKELLKKRALLLQDKNDQADALVEMLSVAGFIDIGKFVH